MEVNYIFIQKNSENDRESIHSKVENMLFSLFNSSSLDKLDITDSKGNSYTIYAELSSEESNMAYLKIMCDEKPAKAAEILDKASQIITKGYHRKDYYITKTYDEASHSFCCRTMSHFGKFERRLRELIYLTIIKLFGAEWFDKTFEKSLQNELKGKSGINKNDLIENALEELSYEQLKSYLFKEVQLISVKDLLDNELSPKTICNLSKEEIISHINSLRPITLWEHFFGNYRELSSVKEDIEYLQEYRNKVMHHKTFTFDEFISVKKRLNKVNKKLEKAIEIMEDIIYSENDFFNVLQNFAKSISEFVTDVVSSGVLTIFIKTLEEAIKPIKEIKEQFSLISFEKAMEPLKSVASLDLDVKNEYTINANLPINNEE